MKGMKGLLLLTLCLPGSAWALCSVTGTTPVAFGSVSSIAVRTTSQSSSTVNGGLSCTGSLLSLLTTNDHFWATVTSSQSGLLGPTGDVIGYTIYANNSTSYPLTRGTAYDFARNGIIDALGLLGSVVPKSVPLYLGTTIGSNVAAGVYTETLSIFWNWNYCSGIGALGVCLGRDISSRHVDGQPDRGQRLHHHRAEHQFRQRPGGQCLHAGHRADHQPGLHQGQRLHRGFERWAKPCECRRASSDDFGQQLPGLRHFQKRRHHTLGQRQQCPPQSVRAQLSCSRHGG